MDSVRSHCFQEKFPQNYTRSKQNCDDALSMRDSRLIPSSNSETRMRWVNTDRTLPLITPQTGYS